MTAKRPEKPMIPSMASSNVTNRNETLKRISTFRLSRRWTALKNAAAAAPKARPQTAPEKTDVGIFKRSAGENVPPAKRPVKQVNRTMTNTSSTDAPAMISCGIPCAVPRFSSMSRSILGTTTAGETAAMTAPRTAASRALIPRSPGARRSIPAISKDAGRKHMRTAGRPTFLSSERSRFRPALVKIMMRAIRLKSAEIMRISGLKRFRP